MEQRAFGKLGTVSAPWSDGWFFSGGVEYAVNPQLTVRTGVAYEISPIKNATDYILALPDADKFWLSGGFSYNVSSSTTIDFGYSHVFVQDATIDLNSVAVPGFKPTRIVANLDASGDIVSVGLRMKLGD